MLPRRRDLASHKMWWGGKRSAATVQANEVGSKVAHGERSFLRRTAFSRWEMWFVSFLGAQTGAHGQSGSITDAMADVSMFRQFSDTLIERVDPVDVSLILVATV